MGYKYRRSPLLWFPFLLRLHFIVAATVCTTRLTLAGLLASLVWMLVCEVRKGWLLGDTGA